MLVLYEYSLTVLYQYGTVPPRLYEYWISSFFSVMILVLVLYDQGANRDKPWLYPGYTGTLDLA